MKSFILILSLLFFSNPALTQDFQKLYSIGNNYTQKGNYHKAITNYKKAEKAATRKFEKSQISLALADSYNAISEYTNAINYYEKILTIYNEENRKKILLNLSGLYILTGQYQKVIDNLRNMQGCPDETVRLTNLSSAYFNTNKANEAIVLLDSVLKIKDSPSYKIALQNKGYVRWRQHKNTEAEKLLSDAVELFASNTNDKYVCMANLALVKSENQKHEDALRLINSAIEWQLKHLGKHNQDYIISVRKKAEILLKAGKTADASTYFKEFFYAEKEYITKNFMYMTEQERLNFWHTVKFQIDKCYQVGKQDAAFLFDVALFQQNVLTLANVNFYQTASNNDKYDILIELRAQMLLTENAEERSDLERQTEKLEKELVDSYDELKNFKKMLDISGADINKVLKPNDVAIDYILYNQNDTMRYAALILQKDKGVEFVPMFTKQEIDNYPIGFSSLIENISKDRIGANMIYYDTYMKDTCAYYSPNHLPEFLWNNVLDKINSSTTRIYFVPDGIFYQLAIEYLCPRMDLKIYRLSSMRVLLERQKTPDYRKALLIGAINYNDTTQVDTTVMPDRLGSLFCDHIFTSLGEESINEIDTVQKIFNIPQKDRLIQNQATEEKVKKMLPKYKTVIFSTHGYSNNKPEIKETFSDRYSQYNSMSKCGIALSGVNVLRNPSFAYLYEDGLLTAMEFSRLDLSNVDLIVFSACQTNVGVITYNGIYNIPRSLKKAGVNSVISTLWEVNNVATNKFMTIFFEQLRLGKSKYEALHLAQNYMRKSESYFQAEFWTPFILIDGLN